jgi:hypothetical protein
MQIARLRYQVGDLLHYQPQRFTRVKFHQRGIY